MPSVCRQPWLYFAAGLSIAIACLGCRDEGDTTSDRQGAAARVKVARGVTVEAVRPERRALRVLGDYGGELRTAAMTEVAAEASGRVATLEAELGDRVRHGATLATIDPTTYVQRQAELEAAVRLAQASVEQARLERDNRRAELERKKPLGAQGLVTERELEDLLAQTSMAEQRLRVAEATVDQNQAKLAAAREELAHTRVRAPFAGLIAERYVERGAHISVGERLFYLVDDSEIFVNLRVPEADAGLMRRGLTVSVQVDALSSVPLRGHVARVSPALDPSTRTLRIDVLPGSAAQQPPERWPGAKPGMYARCQVELAASTEALTVPNQVLLKARDGSPFVWVVRNGRAVQTGVVLGLRGRLRTEVTSGLTTDDLVVARGQEGLSDGAAVIVVDTSHGVGLGETDNTVSGPRAEATTPEPTTQRGGRGQPGTATP